MKISAWTNGELQTNNYDYLAFERLQDYSIQWSLNAWAFCKFNFSSLRKPNRFSLSVSSMKMNVLNFLGLVDEVGVNGKRRNWLKRLVAVLCSAVLLLPSVGQFFELMIIHNCNPTCFCFNQADRILDEFKRCRACIRGALFFCDPTSCQYAIHVHHKRSGSLQWNVESNAVERSFK